MFGHLCFEDEFETEKLVERLLFVEKIEKGLKDVEEGRVMDFKEAKQKFFYQYRSKKRENMKVTNVDALDDYKLQVTFDDGVSGIIDLKDFIKSGIFSVLEEKQFFDKVYTNGHTIAWNDDLEIDSLAVYAEILNKEPNDILNANFSYASN